MSQRVLCLHPGAIGDIVLALPALDNLAAHGDWHVTAACSGDRATLVRMAGIADESINIDTHGLWRILAQPCEALDIFARGHFATAIVWTSDPGNTIRATLTDCGMAPVVTAPAIPPADWHSHASQYYAHTLAPFGVPQECGLPRLTPDNDTMRWATTFLDGTGDRTAVLHPGSGARQKRWPIDRFAQVAGWLRDQTGMHILWMTGQAEDKELIDAVIQPTDKHAYNTTLPQMTALLKSAKIYIGNDSGPTHCAAATGTQTVALFGPTDPTIWAPLGNHVTTIQENTPCAPCTPEKRRACKKPKCMENIPVTKILETIRNMA